MEDSIVTGRIEALIYLQMFGNVFMIKEAIFDPSEI